MRSFVATLFVTTMLATSSFAQEEVEPVLACPTDLSRSDLIRLGLDDGRANAPERYINCIVYLDAYDTGIGLATLNPNDKSASYSSKAKKPDTAKAGGPKAGDKTTRSAARGRDGGVRIGGARPQPNPRNGTTDLEARRGIVIDYVARAAKKDRLAEQTTRDVVSDNVARAAQRGATNRDRQERGDSARDRALEAQGHRAGPQTGGKQGARDQAAKDARESRAGPQTGGKGGGGGGGADSGRAGGGNGGGGSKGKSGGNGR